MKALGLSIEIFKWMKASLISRKQIATNSHKGNYNRVLFLTGKDGKDKDQGPGALCAQETQTEWRIAMDRKEVMELFNKRPRIGSLSTANQKGEVNVAIFGSPQMIDENTVIMGIGQNRSFGNLQENPKAVFIVVEPGETMMDWKGARVYLEAMDIETGGGFYEQIKENIAKSAGKGAADLIHAAVRFKITGVRPIVDTGR
jgi:hypothetical protein